MQAKSRQAAAVFGGTMPTLEELLAIQAERDHTVVVWERSGKYPWILMRSYARWYAEEQVIPNYSVDYPNREYRWFERGVDPNDLASEVIYRVQR